ncbi:nucleic-acid-binding protein [Erythrobacter sp. KY5]|uniref:DUF448 domain-containing protein n=1 Tax=Erythrobacter sp. KY5 TaxID=2011159 RepID=UPI000DBF3333|nr:DUF448 domain-containing protein [Erythrobacter sp. KY5]AWW75458.1 nucleic-acid-binding protein [Erythrobacter sp. KY5]
MRTPPNERVSSDIAEDEVPGHASGSERRCVLSGQVLPREELIRLAVAPDGTVHPDPAGKAPGRGAWIVPDRAALESAMTDGHLKRALMRAFKGGPAKDDAKRVPLSYSDDLPHRIESALSKVLADRLGLELRGGNVVLGSAKIEEHARTGRIALLLHASDSSEDGRKKLDQAWRVGTNKEGSGERGTVLPLDRDALSVALGRENVVHLGVSGLRGVRSKGPSAADRVGQAVTRLSRFMGSDPPD